jgi:hypothetical protein
MDMKPKLRALGLALVMVAAAAGMGWALQLPLSATASVRPEMLPRIATPSETPIPSLPAWRQPAAQAQGAAAARGQAGAAAEIKGLEEMSATGAAMPQR